jgi:8-oxo-dGTP diphosphatase
MHACERTGDCARLQNSEARVMEPDKCEEWQWVKWPTVPQPVFKPLQQLLEGPYQPKDLVLRPQQ